MNSIFGKTFVSHLVVVLVTLLLILALFPTFFAQIFLQKRQEQLANMGSRIAEVLATEGAGASTALLRSLHGVSGAEIWVVNSQGKVLTASVVQRINQSLSETSRRRLIQNTTQVQRQFGEGFRSPMMVVAQPTGPIELPWGTASHVLLFTPMQEIDALVKQTVRKLALLALPPVLCIVLVVAWFMSRMLTKPLVAISNTVQAIGRGQLGAQISCPDRGEIGLLAQGVNNMSRELARLFSSLSEEKQRTESIIAHMSEGVLSIDLQQEEALYNHEAASALGLPWDHTQTLDRCRSTELFLTLRDKEVISIIEATIEKGTIQRQRLQLQNNRTFQITASPLQAPDKVAKGAVVLLSDISQQHRFEASQREFFASISHDLRTPLTVLRGLLQAIKDQLITDPEELAKHIDAMYSQVLHLIALTSTLLEVARLDMESTQLNRVQVSLGELVDQNTVLLEPILKERDVSISVEDMEQLPRLFLDPEKIGRVLYNLLENAILHSPPGGTVVVDWKREGPYLELAVSDEGPGIPPGDEQRIFQPFHKGTLDRSRSSTSPGLGLTIAKKFVELHGGMIWAYNKPLQGATFVIRLPIGDGQ